MPAAVVDASGAAIVVVAMVVAAVVAEKYVEYRGLDGTEYLYLRVFKKIYLL